MKLKLSTALLVTATLFTALSLVAQKAPVAASEKSAAAAVFGKLPLSFEPTADSARFLAHSGGYLVSVGVRDVAVAVSDAKSGMGQTLRFGFDHASAAGPLQALEPQQGVTNYYLGDDPSKWRLGVKNYAKVLARAVYPGVDVVYYGDHRRLEFDFIVAPKADPRAISLSFSGMDKLYKDASGDLVAEVAGRPVRLARPYAYQRIDGVSRQVAAEFELASAGTVHLRIGDYDSNSELVIDPVVTYAQYLGGSNADVANGIAVDGSGNAYVTGQTASSNFPDNPPNPNTLQYKATQDAYIVKYKADGTSYLYTAILGGSNAGFAEGNGIALDSLNQAYIIGGTNFTDLPGVPTSGYLNNLNKWRGGDSDAFISIFDPLGNLVRTSYLGGGSADLGFGIAVDSNQNVIAVGETCSQDFPGYNAFETKIEACVAFITKLNNHLDIGVPPGNGASALSFLATGGSPAYFFSEFYGGQLVPPFPTASWFTNTFYVAGAIIVDPNGNVQIASNSGTSSPALPSASTWTWSDTLYATTVDNTISWVDYGKALIPTFAQSIAYGVALDPVGDIFVAGGTTTQNLSPYSDYGGSGAWVLKVGKNQGGFVYGTALETQPSDSSIKIDAARAIAVDSQGQAYVTGTVSGGFLNASAGTLSSAYQPAFAGGQDAFLVQMSNPGAINYASYLGGSGVDQGLGVAVDASGSAYVTGSTASANFPAINPLSNPNSTPTPGAQVVLSGLQDAFVSKFSFSPGGSSLVFSTFLGGSGIDQGNAIAVDPSGLGNMYVAGTTYSPDLEQLNPVGYVGAQSSYGGGGDGFVAMIAGASLDTVTVTPGSLNFSYADVGYPSAPSLVTYSILSGTSPVTISAITFSNPDFSMANTGANDCSAGGQVVPASVPPVAPAIGYCTISVIFTPSAQGLRTGTMTIVDNTSSASHVVTLSGQGASPNDVLSTTTLTFATAQALSTTSAAQTVTLGNTGKGDLYISSITASGDFAQTNNCGTEVVKNVGSCQITVTFTPTATGIRSGYVTITDNSLGSPYKIILTGTGVLTLSTVSSPVAFPQQAIGVPSAAQSITVKNTDPSQNLVISSATATGDFQANATGCTAAQVPPAGNCTILVTFTPTASGTRSGTLTISGNGNVNGTPPANGTPMPVTFALSGTAGATDSLTPAIVNFNGTNVGVAAPSQPVVLANLSTFPLSVQSIALSGAAAGDFTENDNCGTSVLAAPAFCTINIVFTPTAAGNRNATLTVISGAAASPQTVSIVGVGTAPAVTLSQGSTNPVTAVNFGNEPLNSASSPLPVTLTNSGTAPLNIGSIAFTGAAAAEYSQTNTCGTQVASGASCVVSVVFTPTALNPQAANLVITDNATPATQTVALLGSGVQVGAPTFSPTASVGLSYPNQPLSVASAVQTITVTNTDQTFPLTLSTPVTTGDFQVVAQAGSCTTSLPAKGTCVIAVTFTPTASGNRTGTLSITSNASPTPVVFPLTGIGGAGASLSPTALNLGSANLGATTAAQSVTLTNGTAFPVNISGITMSGPSAAQFSSVNNCGTIVPASGACSVSVVFKPTATGTQTATMTISSDAATPLTPVALTGTGTTPVVSLSPSSLTFTTAQALNTSSSPMTVTLTNTGSGPLNFSSAITILGNNSTDFSQVNTCGSQVAANGGNCTISVTFTPTALNSRIASLTFFDDAANSPQTVALNGTGTSGSGTIQLSSSTLSFGSQQVNVKSAVEGVTVTNSSATTPLTISSITITGANSGDFAIDPASTCAANTVLQTGGTCIAGITFTPTTTGVLETATLSINGSASNSPQKVTLTGTGTTAPSNAVDFTLTPQSTGVTVVQGNTAIFSVTVSPVNGFSSSIGFTCSGPSGSSCSISPNPQTMDGTSTHTVQLSVNTSGGNGTTANLRMGSRSIFFTLLPFTMMGMLLMKRRRGLWLVLMLLVLCLVMGMAGCGAGSGSSSTSGGLQPGSSYPITFTATSTGAAPVTHSLSLTLNVTTK